MSILEGGITQLPWGKIPWRREWQPSMVSMGSQRVGTWLKELSIFAWGHHTQDEKKFFFLHILERFLTGEAVLSYKRWDQNQNQYLTRSWDQFSSVHSLICV